MIERYIYRESHHMKQYVPAISATLSLLRYAVLSHLNEAENTGSKGILFEHLADEAAQVTYVQRLWQFFRSLFSISFSKIFELFKIEGNYSDKKVKRSKKKT